MEEKIQLRFDGPILNYLLIRVKDPVKFYNLAKLNMRIPQKSFLKLA